MDSFQVIAYKVYFGGPFWCHYIKSSSKVDLFDAITSKVKFLCLCIKNVRDTLKCASDLKVSILLKHILKHTMRSKKCDLTWRHVLKHVCDLKRSDFERKCASASQESDFAHILRFSQWIWTKSSPFKAFLLGDQFPCIKDGFNMLKIIFGSSILGHVFEENSKYLHFCSTFFHENESICSYWMITLHIDQHFGV